MLTDAMAAAATLVAAAAILFAAATLAVTRSVRTALPVLLDLLLAAGLLRLAGANTWQAIGSAAMVVVIRKIAVAGLTRPMSHPLRRRVPPTASGTAAP